VEGELFLGGGQVAAMDVINGSPVDGFGFADREIACS
jgi:hypothetical protein